MNSPRIVLATRNQDKLREVREILHCHPDVILSAKHEGSLLSHPEARPKDLSVNILSLLDFPDYPEIEEDGKTFLENAKKKALAALDFTGLTSIGEDSGIVIDALGGRPGIFSARYAGEDKDPQANNRKVLQELAQIPWVQRTARYICVAALVTPDHKIEICEGTCEGLIALGPCGSGGFGYDPIFYLPQYAKTMAELSAAEKNRVSHRAQAFLQIKQFVLDRMKYC